MSLQPDLLRYIAVSPVGPVPQEPRGTGSPLSRGSEVSPPSIPLSYVLTWLLHLTKPNSFLLCLKPIHRNIGPAEPESYSQRLDLHTYHCIKIYSLKSVPGRFQRPLCVSDSFIFREPPRSPSPPPQISPHISRCIFVRKKINVGVWTYVLATTRLHCFQVQATTL